jgi:hypothetical protein
MPRGCRDSDMMAVVGMTGEGGRLAEFTLSAANGVSLILATQSLARLEVLD